MTDLSLTLIGSLAGSIALVHAFGVHLYCEQDVLALIAFKMYTRLVCRCLALPCKPSDDEGLTRFQSS